MHIAVDDANYISEIETQTASELHNRTTQKPTDKSPRSVCTLALFTPFDADCLISTTNITAIP